MIINYYQQLQRLQFGKNVQVNFVLIANYYKLMRSCKNLYENCALTVQQRCHF